MGCYEDAMKRLHEAANRLSPKRQTGSIRRREEEIKRLERAQEHGALAYLIIGGRRVCNKRMYLKTIRRKHGKSWKSGQIAEAELELTFKQYS